MNIDKEREALLKKYLTSDGFISVCVIPNIVRDLSALDEQKAAPSDNQIRNLWVDTYHENFLKESEQVVTFARALLSKYAAPMEKSCKHCDGTGDVHSIDGEWRGACICAAGKAVSAPAPKGGPVAWPRVFGISRDLHPRCLMLSLAQEPTDDQMRAIHDALKGIYAAPVNEQDAALAEAIEQRDIAIAMLAEWCVAVRDNGTGWDDWDEHYKDAAYRPGPLRKLIDAAIAQQGKEEA